jgi:5,10-methylenetetrahydromethanopterin reductase
MSGIHFGVGLYGNEHARQCVELAHAAEDFGFARFWIGDSHMIWRELYVLAGAVAVSTKKIAIGPGVTHPSVRHLSVTAGAMATLHELSAGRAFLGFGVGATGPGNIGLKPHSVAQLEEDLTTLRALLAGQSAQIGGRDARCVYAAGKLPIYVATRAPQGMKITCRVADGFVYTGELNTLKSVIATIRAATAEATRSANDVAFIYRMPCAISDDGVSARESVKGIVARSALTHLSRLHGRHQLHDSADAAALERLRERYDTYAHMGPEHDQLVREEWVDRFALAGTAEEVREKVRGYIAMGIDELTIVPCGTSKRATLERFAREVIEKIGEP